MNSGVKNTFTKSLSTIPLGDAYTEEGEINHEFITGQYSPMSDFIENQYVDLSLIHISLMNKIFRDSKEPLYGRADSIMKLSSFTTSILKEIMSDHKADYTKDDLLALYTFTGGVPK